MNKFDRWNTCTRREKRSVQWRGAVDRSEGSEGSRVHHGVLIRKIASSFPFCHRGFRPRATERGSGKPGQTLNRSTWIRSFPLKFTLNVKRCCVPPPRVYSLRWPRSEQSSPLLSSDWRGKRDGEVSRGASDEALLILLIHFIELPEL